RSNPMMRMMSGLAVLMLAAMMQFGCATAPDTETGRATLEAEAAAAVAQARKSDPTLAAILDDAYAYAVFPTVGKGAVGVGGAYGRGVLYQGGQIVGYCDVSQA